MKKICVFLLIFALVLLPGCALGNTSYDIVATTLPVYNFTSILCEGTELTVGILVTEQVSCLHDYTLQVNQMRMLEAAEVLVISGAGLEDFLSDALSAANHVIDASANTHVHSGTHHDDTHDHTHHHEQDPHIWLSPVNAAHMAETICSGLVAQYPQFEDTFRSNLITLHLSLTNLQNYGKSQLSSLSCRELITFHDGFGYFAESFDLTILEAIEEESGSEASASEIIHLVELVREHHLPAVFTETNGSDACAGIIAAETNVKVFPLDMAMAGNSYFDAMYHNIDTVKEALK